MMQSTLLRHASRASAPLRIAPIVSLTQTARRGLRSSPMLREKSDDPTKHVDEDTRGAFARTESMHLEHPEEPHIPSSAPVQGRGGFHFKRTLASFTLEGRVGIVTGGARGLGLVMSQALVVSGANVAIVDLNKDEAAKQADLLMEHFKQENPGAEHVPKVTAHHADVSSEESVNQAISDIIAEHGKIDHLVTSAGFTENFDAVDYPIDRVRKLWGVNVDGTYLFATSVARHLAASLAVEWAGHDIRVNCISPGYMLTALTKKILDENPELAAKWTSLIPQGKMGSPEDLMGAVTFLLSDAANYITGAELRVDGGYTVT